MNTGSSLKRQQFFSSTEEMQASRGSVSGDTGQLEDDAAVEQKIVESGSPVTFRHHC